VTPRRSASGLRADSHEGYFPAVVDEETFRRAQAASKARGSGKGRTDPTHRNLLRGIAKCEACGANMVFIDKGSRSRGPVLKCGRAHQSAGCTQTKPYVCMFLEVGVMFGLGAKRAELAANAVSVRRVAGDRLAAAVARRDEAKATHERLIDLHLNGIAITIERMQKSTVDLAKLDGDVLDAEAALDRAKLDDPEVDVADILKVYNELERLEPTEQARARAAMHDKLKRLVDRIDVGADGYVVQHVDQTTTKGVRME
jgi:hypothetical protein